MRSRIVSFICIAFFLAGAAPIKTAGQPVDSLLYLLDNNLVKNDSARFRILYKLISETTDAARKMQYCDQAIGIAEKLDIMPANLYVYKGISYLDAGDLASALEWFFSAANYYREYDDRQGLARVYQYISETYNQQKNPDIAVYYLKNTIELYKEEEDSINLAIALTNLGYINLGRGMYDTALVLFSETGDIYRKLGYTSEYAYCIGNSGRAYAMKEDYARAEEYLLRAIDILTSEGDERAVSEYLIEYAGILRKKGETVRAIAFATRGFNIAVRLHIREYERDAAKALADLYSGSGRYDSAFRYQSVYISANDTINNLENIRKMADLRTEFEVSKKQTEVEILEKNKLFQRLVIIGMAVILLLTAGLVLVYYRSLRRTRKLMAALEERRVLLERQSSELKEKNEEIVKAHEELKKLYEITNDQKEEIISSINYAQRIQQAVLPPEAYITELINEHFIFYQPKEIVSGDFYWIKQINHYIILAAADCTGHGVPGAFMSLLGISYLNEIVRRKEITHANQVLNELRKEIKHSLRQTGRKEESRDGIDMAVCVIDTDTCTMQYAGANSPLYIISRADGKPELREIEADTMPVGVHFSSDKSFTNHEIQLEIGDAFYISTDGLPDQTGGGNHSRFGSASFRKLILEMHDKPMFEQKEILRQTLKDWMGDHPQRDDILVIGARV